MTDRSQHAASLTRELVRAATARRPVRAPAWQALRQLLAGRGADRGEASWDAIARAARHGEVVTLAAKAHPALARRLDTAVQRQTLIDMHLHWALERVAKAFAGADVDRVVLLKGSATAYALYDAPTDRVRRDVDVLVDSAQLVAAVEALEADGWRPDMPEALLARGPLENRAWSMVLELPFGLLSCDLHRKLALGERYDVDVRGMLDRGVHDVTVLPVGTPEDTLLHTCMHLATNGFQEPLKAWVDVARLVGRGGLDAAALADRARAWRCRALTWACLVVAERWFEVRPSRALLARLAPPMWQQRALRHLLAGDGPDPLRVALSKHAATGLTGLLICDTPGARARYLSELVLRRVAPATHGGA